MNLYIAESGSYDPRFNLGLEEYIFNCLPEDSVLMYLWQNRDTVVIGRTQNVWKECNLSALEMENVTLARRSTGGGAVYHDLGNLCYSFICTSGSYDQKKQSEVVLEAVRSLGINAEFTGRNDITAEGRKFSGNAFRFYRDRGLMHGTVMVDTDKEKLSQLLNVSKEKLASKGVSSVRSRVVNLKELNPDITCDMVKMSLRASFKRLYGEYTDLGVFDPGDITNFSGIDFGAGLSGDAPAACPSLSDLYNKYSSDAFRFGENPAFDISFEKRFPWGSADVHISSEKGVITKSAIYTDAMYPDFAEELSKALIGLPYFTKDILPEIQKICPPEISEDMCSLFAENI